MELDDILEYIGGFGRFQILMFTLMGIVQMLECGYLLGITFIGEEFQHHCKLPNDTNINDSIPMEYDNSTNKWELSSCLMYEGNKTVACSYGWTFEKDEAAESVVSEWDLVCDKNFVVELSSTIYVAGLMVGSLVVTPLSDRFGRKKLLLLSAFLRTALAVGLAFAQDYIQFSVIRFFIGAFQRADTIISFVLLTEVLPPKHRTKPGIAMQFFWAAGYMGLPLIAYLLPNWRHFELAICLPTVLMVSYYWLVPESPRWLLAEGRIQEAEEILQKIAKMNKVSLPANMLSQDSQLHSTRDFIDNTNIPVSNTDQSIELKFNAEFDTKDRNTLVSSEDLQAEQIREKTMNVKLTNCSNKHDSSSSVENINETVNSSNNLINNDTGLHNGTNGEEVKIKPAPSQLRAMLSLFRSCVMLRYTLILYYIWMVNSLTYYGISLNTSSLAGNKYVNFFASGAVEVPAYLIVMFVLEYFGRRWPMCAFQILSGVANIVTVFIPKETSDGKDLSPLITTLAMIGKFGITGSFCSLFLYSAEIFPTSIRNTAYGIASFWDTLGGMAAPLILYQAKSMPELPRTVFGIAAVIAGLMMLLLPETLNRPMPETVEEIEQWDDVRLKYCCRKKKFNINYPNS